MDNRLEKEIIKSQKKLEEIKSRQIEIEEDLGIEVKDEYIMQIIDIKKQHQYILKLVDEWKKRFRSRQWKNGDIFYKFSGPFSVVAWKWARNQNVITIFDGKMGTGKSSASARWASTLDPTVIDNFKLRKISNAASFIAIIANCMYNIRELNVQRDAFRHTSIIIDEAGQGATGGQFSAVRRFLEAIETMRVYGIDVTLNLPTANKLPMMLQYYYSDLYFTVTGYNLDDRVIYARAFMTTNIWTFYDHFSFNCVCLNGRGEFRLACKFNGKWCKYANPKTRVRLGKSGFAYCSRWWRGTPIDIKFAPKIIWDQMEDNKDDYLYQKYLQDIEACRRNENTDIRNVIMTNGALFKWQEENNAIHPLLKDLDDLESFYNE